MNDALKVAALRSGALLMAAKGTQGEGHSLQNAVRDMRDVLQPIADDPNALEWQVVYLGIVCTRLIERMEPFVHTPWRTPDDVDFITLVVQQIMEQVDTW
jgi:hypothetical protein